MSSVAKGAKKIFKKAGKLLKKIIKPLLIAAAIYFTAGLALSAFPATAGFAASMPGFAGGGFLGTGFGAGASAGTGLFSKAAVKLGLGALGKAGGLVGGALAKGTSAAALSSALGPGAVAGATGVSATGVSTAAPVVGATGKASVMQAAGFGAGGTVAPTTAAKVGMSLFEKMYLAGAGMKAVGAFMQPGVDEIAKAQAKWRGAFYGADESGNAEPTPTMQGPAAMPPRTPTVMPPRTPAVALPQPRQLVKPGQPPQSAAARQLVPTFAADVELKAEEVDPMFRQQPRFV